VGAEVTWNGVKYTTDAQGEIRPKEYYASYNAVQIERYDEATGVPTVLRYAPDYITSFPDVEAGSWYDDAVLWCVTSGVISGSNGNFDPEGKMTRAAVVTVLYRLDGSPETETTDAAFSDVASDAWYADAVAWAAANGIVSGGSDGKFSPEGNITRQDLAVVLNNYIEYKKMLFAVTQEYVLFADEDEIALYAKNAAQLLYKLGIMKGNDGKINPLGTASRAEIAVLLQRFAELEESYNADTEAETEDVADTEAEEAETEEAAEEATEDAAEEADAGETEESASAVG
jgi:hypothetical protein